MGPKGGFASAIPLCAPPAGGGTGKSMITVRWKVFLFLPILLAQAAIAQTLTLRQAIDRALAQNPQAAAARADLAAAGAGVLAARTALLPQLNFNEDLSRGNDPVYVFGTKLRQQRFTQADFSLDALNRPTPVGNFATQFGGQWKLFDGWATEYRLHGAHLAAQSADAMTGAVNQAIVLEVVEAYQQVLYAQRAVDLAQHQVETAQGLLHDAQTRVKAGLAVDSDELAAEVNLAERQQEQIAAQGALDTAWAQLETAMGSDGGTSRPQLQPLEAKSFPEGLMNDDVAAAMKARPDLKALRQQTAAQQQNVKAARAEFLPQIGAYGNWETDRPTIAGDGGNNWVAGVRLSVNLLPLGQRARLRQEKAVQQKAEASERNQELQIRLAVEQAFTGHQTAERMVTTARAAMQQSAEGRRILRNRYNAGLATMTDLLRAEDAERQSQNDYWRAAYGNALAYARLLYATGQLTPDSAENLQ
jgi:outer membrane protein